jgi:Predicted ATPase
MNSPISSYRLLIKNGIWEYDNNQEILVKYLDKLYLEIKNFQKSQNSLIKKFINKSNKPPLGLYIFGKCR